MRLSLLGPATPFPPPHLPLRAARSRHRQISRGGFSLVELLAVMLILGIATSSAIYLFSLPSPRTLVRRQTQHLGLRVARALAWSRESGRRVVMLSTGSGYIVAAAPATGSPGMADVNALGPGMNDDGAVGGTVSAGATVVLKDAVYGTTVTQVSCGSDGRCDTTGPFGAKFEITNGASVGQVFINGRGRVRIILPAR